MTIGAVRDGIKAALASVSGLRTYDVWPDTVNCPCALVRPVRYEAHTTFASRATLHCEVVLLAAPTQDGLARGQDKLDGYLDSNGASSVIAALEAAPTFPVSGADTCEGSMVAGWQDYGSMEVGGGDYLGVRLAIECWVTF